MKELVRFEKYSRKDIHDIFSPDTKFTPQAGSWGLHGIIRVPNTKHDYIFLVTFGKKQSNYEFDENIDENGILTWQSQPSQTLEDDRIIDFINHDYLKNNIYLFLRNSDKVDYEYMGLLAYVTHDNQREKPVHFKWQILNWNGSSVKKVNNHENEITYKIADENEFKLEVNEEKAVYYYENTKREGNNTESFLNNINIDFEGEVEKNTLLGKKGEDVVVAYEKEQLIKAGRKDLADKVYATRNIAGNAERFDVISYDENGKEKYIEVKTTKGGLTNTFHVSENEVSFSEQYKDNYYLYRVYNFNMKTMKADVKIIKGAIDREKLQAESYVCKLK